MVNAESLFKQCGFEKTYAQSNMIVYTRATDGYMACKIQFGNGLVWIETPCTTRSYLKPREIEAINMQLKELGWTCLY